jgi:predicted HAD superfamily Cof-like phosphohydrolase
MIDMINLWFKRAIPEPNKRNLEVQLACHFEEIGELLETLKGTDMFSENLINDAERAMLKLSTALKTGMAGLEIADRREFLDAVCDQIVTATGSAYMAGMAVEDAVAEVNTSNWSKFDSDGNPIFDANGKISKNYATYRKPNLEGLY